MSSKEERTVFWHKDGYLRLIDQRKLPKVATYHNCYTIEDVYVAIKDMYIRGAPAIGLAGAFGMVLASKKIERLNLADVISSLKAAKERLDSARPTAVNLSWATSELISAFEKEFHNTQNIEPEKITSFLLEKAELLADEDVKTNRRMGKFGADLVRSVVKDKSNIRIIHHCNTGSLATVFFGTALGVIFTLDETKSETDNLLVYVDETRPRLQGAKLTTYELKERNIPYRLIADNAAGFLMYKNQVDCILVGADRICRNGDVANKIGTYKLAVCAKENKIPFFVVAPTSTVDLSLPHGDEIEIEERSSTEVTEIEGVQIAAEGTQAFNPAFDITPNKLISAIITENGVCYSPFEDSLSKAKTI
eukprot:maker-scaffold_7-snap-gene-9.8-mRNA-1 protein AED:0.01 eAED:0.01 QI:116/1/1/1/1/1/2/71/363